MAWKKRPKRAVSEPHASSNVSTGPSRKYSPNMPGARVAWKATPGPRGPQAVAPRGGAGLAAVVEARLAHQLQGGEPGGHRHRIAAQGAGLVDRARRGDLRHQLTPATEGAHRHAAADDLAEGAEVR